MDLRIDLIATKDQIPGLLRLEAEINEGETWAFLDDSDNKIYTYSMDKDEIVCGIYPENIGVAELLEKIEIACEEEY